MRNVKVEELIIIFDKLIAFLKWMNAESIDINIDLYNIIDAENWGITNDIEESVGVGSLEDDIDELKKLIVDKDRPCTPVDFDRFSSLLRAIAIVVVPLK